MKSRLFPPAAILGWMAGFPLSGCGLQPEVPETRAEAFARKLAPGGTLTLAAKRAAWIDANPLASEVLVFTGDLDSVAALAFEDPVQSVSLSDSGRFLVNLPSKATEFANEARIYDRRGRFEFAFEYGGQEAEISADGRFAFVTETFLAYRRPFRLFDLEARTEVPIPAFADLAYFAARSLASGTIILVGQAWQDSAGVSPGSTAYRYDPEARRVEASLPLAGPSGLPLRMVAYYALSQTTRGRSLFAYALADSLAPSPNHLLLLDEDLAAPRLIPLHAEVQALRVWDERTYLAGLMRWNRVGDKPAFHIAASLGGETFLRDMPESQFARAVAWGRGIWFQVFVPEARAFRWYRILPGGSGVEETGQAEIPLGRLGEYEFYESLREGRPVIRHAG